MWINISLFANCKLLSFPYVHGPRYSSSRTIGDAHFEGCQHDVVNSKDDLLASCCGCISPSHFSPLNSVSRNLRSISSLRSYWWRRISSTFRSPFRGVHMVKSSSVRKQRGSRLKSRARTARYARNGWICGSRWSWAGSRDGPPHRLWVAGLSLFGLWRIYCHPELRRCQESTIMMSSIPCFYSSPRISWNTLTNKVRSAGHIEPEASKWHRSRRRPHPATHQRPRRSFKLEEASEGISFLDADNLGDSCCCVSQLEWACLGKLHPLLGGYRRPGYWSLRSARWCW